MPNTIRQMIEKTETPSRVADLKPNARQDCSGLSIGYRAGSEYHEPVRQYERADSCEIANFPGVSSPYEEPVEPDLVLPMHEWPVDRCVDTILQLLEERGIAS